jgi:hypothetical protein
MEYLSSNQIDLFKMCLSKLTIKELNDRIQRFRNFVEIRTLTEHRIKQELQNVFTIILNDKPISFFFNIDIQTNPHELYHFYRIRKFTHEDYLGMQNRFFPSMQIEQDAWTRPENEVTEYGRLNRPGEAVLYVSKETLNAIYETGCQPGDHFFLLVYENNRNMRLSQIHNIQYIESFSEEENAKRIIMHNFLLSEFTKFVPFDKKYLYKSSLLIYEEFFLSHKTDGFSYPSITSPCNRGYNVCFTKDQAAQNLTFLGVMVCELLPPNSESEFLIKPILDGFLNERSSFTFYKFNSDFSRKKFGKFTIIRDIGL